MAAGQMKTFYETFSFDRANNLDLYRLMLFVRVFEETLLAHFSTGSISGTTHTSIGQEANAVSIVTCLDRDIDTIWSNHRCHGHFLSYCGDAVGLFSEILGKKAGVCGGRGGSQHLAYRNFFSSGVQGGLAAIAVGTGFGNKERGAISVAFLGDGTMGEGSVYEALNMAALWRSPVLFVVEDNGIAQTTDKRLGVAGGIRERAIGFGIESRSVKSTDVRELQTVASEAIAYVRDERRPFWLHIETTRLAAHSKGDDTRDLATIDEMCKRDCLRQIAPANTSLRSNIEQQVIAYVEEAFTIAQAGDDACA
jgi:TPP-dependent pyruvate/acetoin dehydrogenase alpha subunit